MQVSKEQLRAVAARMVTDGLRRAQALSGEAWQDKRLAAMMRGPEARALRGTADGKLKKAEGIRRLCMLVGTAHGIGPKKIGREWQLPAMRKECLGEGFLGKGGQDKRRIVHEG